MSKVLCIHPYDKTTFFLKGITNLLKKLLSDNAHIYVVFPNGKSHDDCLDRVRLNNEEELIFFLGHGGSQYLLGACGDYAGALVSADFGFENPEEVYNHGHFVNMANLSVFSDKKVFCFSCNSGEDLGNQAVANGAKVFFGFGNLPTSQEEFENINIQVSEQDVNLFKLNLTGIVSQAIEYSLIHHLTFKELRSFIRLLINRLAISILQSDSGYGESRKIADVLFIIKDEMRIFGNKELKLFDI